MLEECDHFNAFDTKYFVHLHQILAFWIEKPNKTFRQKLFFECFPATAVQLLEQKVETNQFLFFRQHLRQHKLKNYQA